MGDFFTIPGRIGVAKGQLSITHHQLNEQKLSLRKEVLTRYYNYQLALELLKIRTTQNEGAYSNYLIMATKFKNGEVTLDEYDASLNAYNTSREEALSQETQVKILKLSLEELIGIPLEEVE
jgi:outer membrane protein TolC